MALGAEDRARLRRIEARLVDEDPALAARFRSWRASAGPPPVTAGWSVVPSWALVAFLVGFTTWVVAPAAGVAVVAAYGVSRLHRRAVRVRRLSRSR